MATKKITITATSAGYYGGCKAQISVDGQEIGFGNYSSGLNVAVFDETTALPLFATSFETRSGNSDLFADFINNIPEGKIVAVAVHTDAAYIPLTDKAKAACNSIGSAQIEQLQAIQSWALVGIKGHEAGTAHESISWVETSSSYTLDIEPVTPINSFAVEVISTPSTMGADYSLTGGDAQIKVNGQLLTPEGGYKSGLNLVVLDRKTGQVKLSGGFNPWLAAELDKFVQILNDLQPGEVVAIVTKDYIGTEVYQTVKKACASIGSTLVGDLKYGGNWVIVGYKGAKPGRAVESLRQIGGEGVKVKYWSAATAPVNKDFKVAQKLWVSGASRYFSGFQSVGIDGDYALVGDFEKGNAYIYRWHDGQWQLQQQLLPKDQQGGNFGYSVDISGNLAIVGQYSANASGKTSAGAAHIYEIKDGQWQHQEILQPSDLMAGDGFGNSVVIDGKVAIVGAIYADAQGKSDCGAAYIFHLENGKWVQKAKLQPLDLGAGDYFGARVSISGNVAIVGAIDADTQGKDNCGAAYIFHLENGKWVQQHKLQPLDLGAGDRFGCSVAIAGNWAIVGAYYADVAGKTDAGAAYIFQLQDGIWQLHQKIQANDPNTSDWFGYSVAIGGDVAIVGAYYADASGKSDAGAAYMFQLGNSKWEQKQKLQPDDLLAYSYLGTSTAFDGRRAIIGSPYYYAPGCAYICNVTAKE